MKIVFGEGGLLLHICCFRTDCAGNAQSCTEQLETYTIILRLCCRPARRACITGCPLGIQLFCRSKILAAAEIRVNHIAVAGAEIGILLRYDIFAAIFALIST